MKRIDLTQTGPHITLPATSLPTFWAGVFILGTVWGAASAPIYGWPCAVGAGLAGLQLVGPHISHRH